MAIALVLAPMGAQGAKARGTGFNCGRFLSGLGSQESGQAYVRALQKLLSLGVLTPAHLEEISLWPQARDPMETFDLKLPTTQLTRAFRELFQTLMKRNSQAWDWDLLRDEVVKLSHDRKQGQLSRKGAAQETQPVFAPVKTPWPGVLNPVGDLNQHNLGLAGDGYPIFYNEFHRHGFLVDGKSWNSKKITGLGRDLSVMFSSSTLKAVIFEGSKTLRVVHAETGDVLLERQKKGIEKATNRTLTRFSGPDQDAQGRWFVLGLAGTRGLRIPLDGGPMIKFEIPPGYESVHLSGGRLWAHGLFDDERVIRFVELDPAQEPAETFEIRLPGKAQKPLDSRVEELSGGRSFLMVAGKEANYVVDLQTRVLKKVPLTGQVSEPIPAWHLVEGPQGRPLIVVEKAGRQMNSLSKLWIYEWDKRAVARVVPIPIHYLSYEKSVLGLPDGRTVFITYGVHDKPSSMLDRPRTRAFYYDFSSGESAMADITSLNMNSHLLTHGTDDGRIELYYTADWDRGELARAQIYGPLKK